MMSGNKFRRTGAFVIDLLIAKMFMQIVVSVFLQLVTYIFSRNNEGIFSLNDPGALPILLGFTLCAILVFIGTYLGYSYICCRLIKKTLGKYLLSVDTPLTLGQCTLSDYMQMERKKITLCVATLGLYALYSLVQYYVFNKRPYHELAMA